MEIRKFHISDLDDIISLHREVLIRENAYRGDGIWESDLHNIQEIYLNSRGDFVAGIIDNRIIAMGALKQIDDETAEITRMRVHPDFQGKGYGRDILLHLEKTALLLNYRKLVLETDKSLTAAIKLYKRNGFTCWKSEFLHGYDCVWYVKSIS